MKCPNCGNEMEEGNLYCEFCGEDIHIVPDFEPEIETSIRESLSGLTDEVWSEDNKEITASKDTEAKEIKKKFSINKVVLGVCLFFVSIILILAGVGAVLTYQYNSSDYQLKKASAMVTDNRPEDAVAYYQRVLEIEPNNIAVKHSLADIYGVLGNENAYMTTLLEIAESTNASDEEVEYAYSKIVNWYKEKSDYSSISILLNSCKNDSVKAKFQAYLSLPPEFSYKEGTYDEVVPLKLISSTPGIIYYTLNGDMPDLNSEVYTAPIFLEKGSYSVTAVFVNEFGIQSEVVSKTYRIEILTPSAPEVSTYSGDYYRPGMIMVNIPEDCNVYYTTDGTVPTDQSLEYTGSIPMPLGRSIYRFITYNQSGVASNTTFRQYDLVLDTEYTSEMAAEQITSWMIGQGKILNALGETNGAEGKYKYTFQNVLTLEDGNDYYFIYEVYEDTAGSVMRTGSIFAVNAYTAEAYKAVLSESGEFTITPLSENME